MLEALTLRNFQCFVHDTVEFAPLTLLAGESGSGKSAVFRACLTLQQSFILDGLASGLQLNGPLARLGAPEDALCDRARTPGLDLTLKRRADIRRYCFTCKPSGFVFSRQSSLAAPFPEPLIHLGPDRAHPRRTWPVPTPFEQHYTAWGESGQFAPWRLSRDGGRPAARTGLLPADKAEDSLLSRTEFWLSAMTGPLNVHLRTWPGTENIGLEYASRSTPERPHRADQGGSGIQAALPVIAAALAAAPGSLLLVEHPEVCLSPGAERIMGFLLALTAADGIQIAAETRGGALLDGVRQAARSGFLPSEQVAVNLFARDETGAVRILRPELDDPALITSGPPWPA